jgi:hypothetical protein
VEKKLARKERLRGVDPWDLAPKFILTEDRSCCGACIWIISKYLNEDIV